MLIKYALSLGDLQMRTSVLFGPKNFGFFEIYNMFKLLEYPIFQGKIYKAKVFWHFILQSQFTLISGEIKCFSMLKKAVPKKRFSLLRNSATGTFQNNSHGESDPGCSAVLLKESHQLVY